jgi:putative metallohydrolase (TIGR04338 family)
MASLPNAVYRAEGLVLDPISRRFSTMAELTGVVAEITASGWWSTQFPAAADKAIRVEPRSSSASYSLAHSDGLILIGNSPRHRTLAVVLHELAHIGTGLCDGHGPIFRTAMGLLVRRFMGFPAAVELEAAYRAQMPCK